MNLDLNEEQILLQRTVRDFAEAEVKPHARELDETGHSRKRKIGMCCMDARARQSPTRYIDLENLLQMY